MRGLLAGCLAALALASQAGAMPRVQPETVERRLSAGDRFAWTARYDAQVREGALEIRVCVHLVPGEGVTRAEVDRAAGLWRTDISKTWGDALAFELPSGETLPIRVDVSFQGPRYHHEVIVGRGGHRADPLHWRLGDAGGLVAHEFGHLLGAHDDYAGGAVSPGEVTSDRESVMRAGPRAGVARPRHLADLAAWFEDRTGLAVRVVAAAAQGTEMADAERASGRPDAPEQGERP